MSLAGLLWMADSEGDNGCLTMLDGKPQLMRIHSAVMGAGRIKTPGRGFAWSH